MPNTDKIAKYNQAHLTKFKEEYIRSGNITEAMLAVNNRLTRPSASVQGQRLLKQVIISDNEWLESVGVTDGYLAGKTKEGLEADKQIVTGEEVLDRPDYAIRHKYLETAYKLKGKLQPAGVTVNQDNRRVVVALPSVKTEE